MNNEPIEANFTEIDSYSALNDSTELTVDVSAPSKFSIRDAIAAIAAAVAAGTVSKRDAVKFRHDLGIYQSYFTRKQTPKSVRQAKRKAQRAARKVNRKK